MANKRKPKPISIDWEPKEAIDGMMQLDAMEELACRRIIDFIYITQDDLKDDDKQLAWMTKTGRSWKKIKHELVHVHKKLIITDDGRITNLKCQVTLQKVVHRIEQASEAGKESAASRRQLNLLNTGSTDVTTEDVTDRPTEALTEVQQKAQPSSNKQQVSIYSNPPLPPLNPVENYPPEINLNDFLNIHPVMCRMLGIQVMEKADQEILCEWIEVYDIRAFALPLIEQVLGRYRAKNHGSNPSSLAYFDPALRAAANKTSTPIRGFLKRITGGSR